MKQTVVVIPAYKPRERLLELVRGLASEDRCAFVIVDDGSGAEYAERFAEAETYADVIRHDENRGKGQALKTGFAHVVQEYGNAVGVVTVDADGQHHPDDVLAVIKHLEERPERCVLGVRFGAEKTDRVPARNSFGNRVTRCMFSFATGWNLRDTQTGLRGIPMIEVRELATLPGECYEYEMRMLARWAREGMAVDEVPIQTLYPEEGESHFRPVIDSMKILWVLFRFVASSLAATFVDYVIYSLLIIQDHSIISSLIAARCCSTLLNFAVNRTLVFRSSGTIWRQAASYYTLAVALVLFSWGGISMLDNWFGVHPLPAKLIIESLMFVGSFIIQRSYVFSTNTKMRGQ